MDVVSKTVVILMEVTPADVLKDTLWILMAMVVTVSL